MDDSHDDLPPYYARAEQALGSLLARYAAQIHRLRRAGDAAPPGALERLMAERQELQADQSTLVDLDDEQLAQVAAIYEARNEAFAAEVENRPES